jgi:hypothetical protein
VQRLRETHQDQVKKLEALCRQSGIDMQVIYDQEEKGDRQERRERLAAIFREAFTLFDENNEQFGIYKLLSLGQPDPDEDSDAVPLEKIHKKVKKEDGKEEKQDVTQVMIRKPYDVRTLVKACSPNVDDNKELE